MNEEDRSDEVSLSDLFNVLLRYKLLLLSLPVICAVLATVLVTLVLRPTWQASVILEVGTVGPTPVEPVTNVVTRMMLPSFPNSWLNSRDFNPQDLSEAEEFVGTLKVAQVKGSDLVEVKLRGGSQEMAKRLLQGAVTNLQKTHAKMMAVTIERHKKQLQILTEDIHKVDAENELLRKKLFGSHNWNAFDATLSATILKDKSADLRNMIQSKLALEELLSPSRTYTTRIIDEIYASDAPVSPKKGLIVGLAILLGLFGAVIFAFAHNSVTSKLSR